MRNLIRRFVEAGVSGYHIEDQRPGTKKCGHQGGKVLVPSDEQIKRLNTARFQLDIMKVPGIIVARTDAEAANLIDGRADERDQPFLLGATNLAVPPYKSCFLAMLRRFHTQGVTELNGHLLYALPEPEYATADAWLAGHGITALIDEAAAAWTKDRVGFARRPVRSGRVGVRRRLAERCRPGHLRQRRRRIAALQGQRGRGAGDEAGRMARVRHDRR